MTTGTVFNANQFKFFINKNDDYQKSFTGKPYNIVMAPTKDYVYPNANEFELRALADFIYESIGEKKFAGLRNGKIVEFSSDRLSLNHDHIDQIVEIELDKKK
jgi:hypothetical protein